MIELERDERQIVGELCSMSKEVIPSAVAKGVSEKSGSRSGTIRPFV